MLPEPLVSIIIPTYNRAHLVTRAIDSALVATVPGDEIIVVDDGSSDNTKEILTSYKDSIKYILTTNSGAGAARNRGIREAVNPLIAFLDSDDEWMPDKLQLQRALMRMRPDILFCFSNFACRYHTGEEVHNYLINWHNDHRSWNDILGPGTRFSDIATLPKGRNDFSIYTGRLYFHLMTALYVKTSTVMVRRVSAGKALHFAEDIPLYEDWECFARLAQTGTAAYLECETEWNHGHTGHRLTDADSMQCSSARIKILGRIWGSDKEFLAGYAEAYGDTLKVQRLVKAKALLCLGRVKEARLELQLIEGAPMSLRILSLLPGAIVKRLLDIRSSVKSLRWHECLV